MTNQVIQNLQNSEGDARRLKLVLAKGIIQASYVMSFPLRNLRNNSVEKVELTPRMQRKVGEQGGSEPREGVQLLW